MILLSNVAHEIRIGSSVDRLISNTNVRIPSDRRIALLGSKPPISSALFDLLCGMVPPVVGTVTRFRRISFPVGFSRGFSPELTVRQNVEYVAKLYDQPLNQVVEFVATWSEIGPAFDQPLIKLPRPAMREVTSIVALSIPFDMYLVTANRAVSVSPMWRKFYELFKIRAATSGFIASTDPHFARLHCDMGMLLRNHRLELFEDIEDAILIASQTASSNGDSAQEDDSSNTERPVDDWF